jgi:hypothetical protein
MRSDSSRTDDVPHDDPGLDFAVVVLASRASPADRDRVAEMVGIARAIGARGIVVAVPKGWRAPEHSRVVHATPGAPAISAVRLAMAQLSNTSARYVLLWPLESATDVDALSALVAQVQRDRPALASFEGADLDHDPMMLARESWLELMTLGQQGMQAVADRLGISRVSRARST